MEDVINDDANNGLDSLLFEEECCGWLSTSPFFLLFGPLVARIRESTGSAGGRLGLLKVGSGLSPSSFILVLAVGISL